jgi:RNA polymerase-binding transcription factor DksA
MSRPYEQAQQAMKARLVTLLGRETKIASHLRGGDGRLEADFEDVVSFVAADEVLEGLEDAALAEIGEIRAACARIEEGTYGICESCSGDIPAKRLAVLPQVRLCVTCAAAAGG